MKKYLLLLSFITTTVATDLLAMLTKKISRNLKKSFNQTHRFNSTSTQSHTETDPKLTLTKMILNLTSISTYTGFRHYDKNSIYAGHISQLLKHDNNKSLDTVNQVRQNLDKIEFTSNAQDILHTRLDDLQLSIKKNKELLDQFDKHINQHKAQYNHPYIKTLAKYFFTHSLQFDQFTKNITNNYIDIQNTQQSCFNLISKHIEANALRNNLNNLKNTADITATETLSLYAKTTGMTEDEFHEKSKTNAVIPYKHNNESNIQTLIARYQHLKNTNGKIYDELQKSNSLPPYIYQDLKDGIIATNSSINDNLQNLTAEIENIKYSQKHSNNMTPFYRMYNTIQWDNDRIKREIATSIKILEEFTQ